jgi:hypothetical protein
MPYNPQGQATVKHVHATLKMQLKELQGGDEHKALYTLNFLNCPEQGLTPTERH